MSVHRFSGTPQGRSNFCTLYSNFIKTHEWSRETFLAATRHQDNGLDFYISSYISRVCNLITQLQGWMGHYYYCVRAVF